MSAVGVLAAVLAALAVGYVYGRRSTAARPTWRQRTTRLALGRQAAGLAVLQAAAQLQRRVERRLPGSARPRRRPSASFRRW
jgi:hypothetical protein